MNIQGGEQFDFCKYATKIMSNVVSNKENTEWKEEKLHL